MKTYYSFFWKFAPISDSSSEICIFVSNFLLALFDIKVEFLVFNGLNEPVLFENISFLLDSIKNGYDFYSNLEKSSQEKDPLIRALTHKLDCGLPLLNNEILLLKDQSVNFKKYCSHATQWPVVNFLKCLKRLIDANENYLTECFLKQSIVPFLLNIFKRQCIQNRIFIEAKIEDLKIIEV
jgi:hypothetical protein